MVFCAHAFSVVLISRLDDLDMRAMSASFALYRLSAPRTSSGVMSVGGRRADRLFGHSPFAGDPSPSAAAAVPFSPGLSTLFVSVANIRSRKASTSAALSASCCSRYTSSSRKHTCTVEGTG